jgi:hypothetical protein
VGDDVTVVSYGADREALASIEEGCFVLESHGAVRMLSCNVVQGSSGAPVLRVTEEGPEIVAVIAAMATDRTGRDVSMAVALEGPFAELLDQLDRGARPGALSGTATSTGVLSSRKGRGWRPVAPRRTVHPALSRAPGGLETRISIAHLTLVPMPDAGRRIPLDGARMPGPLRTSLSLNGG